jgi:branched-chain amino acid transport system ATP-binding protein
MLAVARALIVAPSVLILDEPSAGLSPKIATEVFRTLKAINQTGVTILLVEQNVKAALAIAHRGVILVDGKLRHEGPAATLAGDPVVAELYLGAHRPAPVVSA